MKKDKELEKTIMFDLEGIKSCYILKNKRDFLYHLKLLEGNLKDYFVTNIKDNHKCKEVIR